MPASVDLSPTGSTTVDATGVSGDPDDTDGDQTVDIFLTGCTSSDARFVFSTEHNVGSVVNKDFIFPTASAIEPTTVVTASNTARRRAVGDPGGGMVTVSGKLFDPDAQFIVGGTDVSIPPDVRTTVTNSDGTVTEVQAASEEVMNWQVITPFSIQFSIAKNPLATGRTLACLRSLQTPIKRGARRATMAAAGCWNSMSRRRDSGAGHCKMSIPPRCCRPTSGTVT